MSDRYAIHGLKAAACDKFKSSVADDLGRSTASSLAVLQRLYGGSYASEHTFRHKLVACAASPRFTLLTGAAFCNAIKSYPAFHLDLMNHFAQKHGTADWKPSDWGSSEHRWGNDWVKFGAIRAHMGE